MIAQFKGEYRFLSNFYECRVEMADPESGVKLIGDSSEHLYQALKFRSPEDRAWILMSADASIAKTRARSMKARIRPDWPVVKFRFMGEVVRAKFKPGSALAERLLNTWPESLVEGNTWGDQYWGVDLKTRKGENRLGEILVQVRDELWSLAPISTRRRLVESRGDLK